MNAMLNIKNLAVAILLENIKNAHVDSDETTPGGKPKINAKTGLVQGFTKPYRKVQLTLSDGTRAWVTVEMDVAVAPAVEKVAAPAAPAKNGVTVRRAAAVTPASVTSAVSPDLMATLQAMLEGQKALANRLASLESGGVSGEVSGDKAASK